MKPREMNEKYQMKPREMEKKKIDQMKGELMKSSNQNQNQKKRINT